MKKKRKKIKKKSKHLFVWLCSCGFLLGLIALSFSSHWPMRFWWIVSLIQIGPLWVFLVFAILLLLISMFAKNRALMIVQIFSILIIIFGVMRFKINIPFGSDKESFVKVMSVNLGEKADVRQLVDFLDRERPAIDIIAFQEASGDTQRILKKHLFSIGWSVAFQKNQGVTSRYRIRNARLKNRRHLGEWGGIIGQYSIEADDYNFSMFNVHIESPREGVEALMHQRLAGIEKMQEVTKRQQLESSTVAQWISSGENMIIAGDFNMLESNPIYQFYFSKLTNVFSQKGFGFGFTKYTSWHGARIDHILTDKQWKVIHAKVAPDMGGDHRPVITTLKFLGRKGLKSKDNSNTSKLMSRMAKNEMLIEEYFEDSLGRFASQEGAEVFVDTSQTFKGRGSLHANIETTAEFADVGFSFSPWVLQRAPVVEFTYKISEGAPVLMRVMTSFGDWLCVGGTKNGECPHPSSRRYTTLLNDGKWHRVKINVHLSVRSVVSAMKSIKAFEFYFPENRRLGDNLLLDYFVVYKPLQ